MHRPLSLPICAAVLFVTFGPAAALNAQEARKAEVLWRGRGQYRLAVAPAAADLDLDGSLEIIVATPDGRVAVVDPQNGKALWEAKFEVIAPIRFTPTWGHFTGDGTIDLLLFGGENERKMILLDGLSGDLLTEPFDLPFVPKMGPTTVAVEFEDQASATHRDGVVIMGRGGELICYVLHEGRPPSPYFRYTLDRVVKLPLATGRTGFEAPAPHMVAVTSQGKVSVLSATASSGRSMSFQISNRRINDTLMALGDLNGDGLDDIVVADDLGYIYAFGVQGEISKELWPPASIVSRPEHPLALADVNGDGSEDVLIARVRTLNLLNGRTGRMDLWEGETYNHGVDITAPPGLFRGADGRVYAVLSDGASRLTVLDISPASGDRPSGPRVVISLKPGVSARESPLLGSIRAQGRAEAYFLDLRTGAGVLADLGIAWSDAEPAWRGSGGGPWKTSGLSRRFAAYSREQHQALLSILEENVRLAEQFNSESDWDRAREHAYLALAANPRNEAAQAILRNAWLHENFILLLVGIALALVIGALIVWQSTAFGLRRARLALANRLTAQGEKAKAAELMLKVHRGAPGNARHLKTLADLYVATKSYNAGTADVFSKARQAFPEEEKYIKALATSYSSDRRRDREAARAYADMVRISSHPGPWAFVLGQALVEAGEEKAALDAFHKAVRHGFDDAVMPNHLADLYIKLSIDSPEILPTMTRVLDERENDAGFLGIFCRACAKSRAYDDNAQKAATWLLTLDPDAKEAHIVLSSRLLQSGKPKGSMKHAEALLKTDPNDSIGLRLLGACYAAERRLDDTAMEIFNRALAANPRAGDILVAVSHGYIQRGREDERAKQTYARALTASPQEETILKQLAKIAGREQDDETTIRSVETLLEMGQRSRELVMQLAEAYCRKARSGSKAEEIYREALVHQPDHATIAAKLAEIYLGQKRTDAESAAIYESVYQADPTRRDVGRQLALSFSAADMAERTLELAKRLLEDDPTDGAMKKLVAQSSDALDHMDSAILGYEQVLESNPEDEDSICRLAYLYGRKRLAGSKAMKIYQRSIRIETDNLEFHTSLARACAAKDNWEQVVMTVKHYLSHAPQKMAPALNLMEELVDATKASLNLRWFLIETLIYDGRLREANRHLVDTLRIDATQAERALSSYDRIIDKRPKEAVAHQQRGKILLSLDRESEARHALELAHRYDPNGESIQRDLMDLYQLLLEKRDSPDVRFQLGRLAMNAAKYDLAISCFQHTDKDYRWENESVRNLARCFMAKGMLDLALTELRRLPVEDEEVKEALYELGQRYEAVNDVAGAREVYKAIFATDIGYKDVKGKLETLVADQADPMSAERTAIINALSEEAKARYELIQELGRGAMGIVYKARDNELEEMVALKILPDTLGNNPEALRRFKQEARNARRLSHPNIVRIHDIGEELGRKYISMEFVDGFDLKQRILETKRNLPFKETLDYSKQICEALAAAHDANIVHRDIKPANIMITSRGKVKITDFGIAKMMQDDTGSPDATKVGTVVGTPLYMSPEQVQGKRIDHRADIYSLGILMYEMAEGTPPFIEGDLAYHHVFTEPEPITRDVPEEFKKIVMKALSKKPEDRYESAGEVLEDLNKSVTFAEEEEE